LILCNALRSSGNAVVDVNTIKMIAAALVFIIRVVNLSDKISPIMPIPAMIINGSITIRRFIRYNHGRFETANKDMQRIK